VPVDESSVISDDRTTSAPTSGNPTAVSGPPGIDLLDALPDAALLVDDSGAVVWGNPAAERLFGMRLEQASGTAGLDLVHPDDIQMAALSLASVQSKDVGTPIELRVRGADGWRLVEMIGAPVDGNILLSVRDLTDRRRWEVAGDEVARFRSLMQNATSITMLLSPDGTVRATSGAVTRILGLDQEWLEGRHVECLASDDDRRVLLQVLREAGNTDGDTVVDPITVDVRLNSATGDPVPFALTFTNLVDDPTVQGLVVTGHDITDRVRTEDDLRRANSVLAATLESTADGILVVDETGRIVSLNTRFAEMWRLSPEAVRTRDDSHLISVVTDQLLDPAAFVAKTQELYADRNAHSHDLIEFKDGRVFERDSLPQRIDGQVVGRVWSFRDVTDHRRMQKELLHQALHDPLTGLANQALFRDRIEHATARLERSGGRLAVLFIDLDDFKTVNDSLGHSIGDELLVSVSRRLAACVRPGDTAARLGGDEFAVLIDELVGPEDGTFIAERIIAALTEPLVLSGRSVAVSASIGITYGTSTVEADEVLRNADLAMYTAKATGKNCYRVFAEEMHHAAVERLDLEMYLRGAADREELVIHYQPIFELDGGRIAAMEALVRWNHPERGLLGPVSFIPFAEEGGLIDEIGQHVLVRACEEACRWARAVGTEAPAISVNLSPRQLLDPQFPDRVELLLHRCGLAPAQLILEITEGALMEDPVAAVASLQRLSRLGVRLAVDDFGTGYSSLAYLQQFPVDLLKIDGSFVDDSLLQPGWSLVEAIVQISHALGLVPIAEGIESSDEAAALTRFGCDLGQGFHLGRPVPAEQARELIRRSTSVRC
jgi:diguanylate cyclase (GGDEF)-like protein/PAS domain S-box-containing protein